MVDGRLTAAELDTRVGALYEARTREQARLALDGLPPLESAAGDGQAPVPALPAWAMASPPPAAGTPTPPAATRGGGTPHVPTDGEMSTAYRRWQAKAEQTRADKAAHKQAEASGDARETARALFRLKMSRGEERSARAKLDQLRQRRPDWSAETG